MKGKLSRIKSRAIFTFVGGMLVINPAFAQSPPSAPVAPAVAAAAVAEAEKPADEATVLDTLEVTGIRSSLDEAMGIRRDSIGVVDAISAEDIGKFPDTNL